MPVATAVLTLLFTDIEGSTLLWEHDADGMEESVSLHFDVLRTVVGDHRGSIVKYTGDGIFATFARPLDGVRAAAAAQRALSEVAWPVGDLRVRMGLNTGECSARGGDHYGRAVNKAARIEQAAYGGQVLLGAATAILVRDHLAADLSLAYLGEHYFDGLIEPERVYQLSVGGLVNEHPPLRTRDVGIERLPVEVTPLLGRGDVVSGLEQDLSTQRVISLVGPPGVGKSRLALRLATEVARERGSGVRFIDLATCRRVDSTDATVATALGARPSEDDATDFLDGIVRALRATDTLVVLDNCEHLLPAITPLVDVIVSGCPRVTILATSRERLGTTPELVYPLQPLELPAADEVAVVRIAAAPAVQLFVDRARAVAADFELTPENAVTVASVCQRCDGLPLALELAAARLGALSPQELLDALDASIDVLEREGGPRAKDRYQGLRESLDLSYASLSPAERDLFDELGTFAGFASVAAISSVCRVSDDAVRSLLESLLRRSLLVARRSGGWTRFRQLESIRQYAREHSRVDDDLRARHAAHFVQEAETLGHQYRTGEGAAAARAMTEQFDDFRLAVNRLLEWEHWDEVARIVLALHDFCMYSNRTELQTWADQVHPHLSRRDPRCAEVGGVRAMSAWFRGDHEHALTLATEALVDADVADGPVFTMWSNTAMLNASAFVGDYDRAAESIEAVQRECVATKDPYWIINALAIEAIGLTAIGLHDQALEPAARAVRIAEELGNLDGRYWASYVQAVALRATDLDGAEEALDRALAATRANGSRFNEGNVLMEQLSLQIERGRIGAAAATGLDLLGHLERAGGYGQIWQAILWSCQVLVDGGRDNAAALLLTAVGDRPRLPQAGDEARLAALVDGLAERLGTPAVEQIEGRSRFLTDQQIIETCRRELEAILRS